MQNFLHKFCGVSANSKTQASVLPNIPGISELKGGGSETVNLNHAFGFIWALIVGLTIARKK